VERVAQQLKKCGACGKPIRPRIATCPWCGSGGTSPEAEEEPSREVEQLLDWMRSDAPPPPVPPAYRLRTMLWILLTTGLVAAGAILPRVTQEMLWGALVIPGMLVAPFALYAIIVDWILLFRRRLGTAEQTLRFYLAALCHKRFPAAAYVIAPYRIHDKRDFTSRVRDFASAWKSAAGFHTSITQASVQHHVVVSPDAEWFMACFTFSTRYQQGNRVMTETVTLELARLVVRHGDRWFLVSGLPHDRIDRRLIGALPVK
jgi:hypothetical protein